MSNLEVSPIREAKATVAHKAKVGFEQQLMVGWGVSRENYQIWALEQPFDTDGFRRDSLRELRVDQLDVRSTTPCWSNLASRGLWYDIVRS